MMRRLLCLVAGHRWEYERPMLDLVPAVRVAWPCVCARCGKERGILAESPPWGWM